MFLRLPSLIFSLWKFVSQLLSLANCLLTCYVDTMNDLDS